MKGKGEDGREEQDEEREGEKEKTKRDREAKVWIETDGVVEWWMQEKGIPCKQTEKK